MSLIEGCCVLHSIVRFIPRNYRFALIICHHAFVINYCLDLKGLQLATAHGQRVLTVFKVIIINPVKQTWLQPQINYWNENVICGGGIGKLKLGNPNEWHIRGLIALPGYHYIRDGQHWIYCANLMWMSKQLKERGFGRLIYKFTKGWIDLNSKWSVKSIMDNLCDTITDPTKCHQE